MLFKSIVRDIRDGFGSLSRRNIDTTLTTHLLNSQPDSSVQGLDGQHLVIQNSCWANLPRKLLCDVARRLEESETTWPARKHVVACAGVCRSWRIVCKEIVKGPELYGKLTFPVSLKHPGPRDGAIQCFIKRDAAKLTYHLFLYLSPYVLIENGKFLLSAKKNRRPTFSEYIISMDADIISESSNTYFGKLRSNFLGTKLIMYDTQSPCTGQTSQRFYSKKLSPKVPTGIYSIGQITYELKLLGTRGPRKMQCTMHSIPASALDAGGVVPDQPELLPRSLDNSFRSSRFSEFGGPTDDDEVGKTRPLVLKNKPPRWNKQLQCWCINFHGRVTVSSVKNFQLIAAAAPTPSSQPPEHDKIILQFGKVDKDLFTMDYSYPLSAFQAFAICLSSFDTKWACE